MAYVYRHIRLDKNEPFYIGIGLNDDGFKRAYTKVGRNKYWNNIVSKTDYEVEIILYDIPDIFAYEKEQEFISLYKRRKDGGTLSNLTLGGEGQKGIIPWNFGKETPEETRKKQAAKKIGKPSHRKGVKISQHIIDAMAKGREGKSSWNKGIPMSQETKDKRAVSMVGKYGGNKGFHHTEELKKHWSIIRKGVSPPNKGVKMSEQQRSKMNVVYDSKKKAVLQYDLDGNFIKEYESLSDAVKQTGFKKGTISNCVAGRKFKSSMGYVWKYK